MIIYLNIITNNDYINERSNTSNIINELNEIY